jgi:nucleotide-binding universal stress UspA family protein
MSIFAHMLVPLDGSHLAEAVLPTTFGLAARLDARVTLLHVLERGAPHTVHGEPHLTDAAAAERYLSQLAARYAESWPKVDYHVHANKENNVAVSIVDHAKELGADLIVLTPHGGGNIRRWLVGSIPQLVLQRGDTPVLFVPTTGTGASPFQLLSLLVPLDGSAASEAVLPIAREIAASFDASIHLVQVVPTLSTVKGDKAATAVFAPSATASALDLEESFAREYIAKLAATWPEARQPSVEVIRGEPTHSLLDLIERTRPDLVLMSTHGHAGLSGLWSASVAPRIASRSLRPLLMLRVRDS